MKQRNGLRTRAKEIVIIGSLCFIGILIMHCFHITCPIKFITGISCPGCGMTRACICALQFNFMEAFMYHPLWILMIPAVICLVIKEYIPKKTYNGLLIGMIITFFVVYLYRMFQVQDIVVFQPENGLIFRILSHVF